MKVLLVDDDRSIVSALARWLQSPAVSNEWVGATTFEVDMAWDAMTALQRVGEGGYAVVVSDYDMPGMNGVQLLEQIKRLAPLTVRIMLSGQADLTTACEAVSRGSVFRFLTKPCIPPTFTAAVVAGLRQHALLTAEHQLLEQTLGGTVRLLMNVLTVVNPSAACRAQRIRRCVQHMARTLELSDGWELEVAAALSHVGLIALGGDEEVTEPDDPLLSEDAKRGRADHPALAQCLLAHIPRLEGVAAIIGHQQDPVDPRDMRIPLHQRHRVRLGGQVLRVALQFDASLASGASPSEALQQMRERPTELDAELVESLATLSLSFQPIPGRVPVNDLLPGMILDEDLHGQTGVLLMKRGQEMTLPMVTWLKAAASKQWLRTKTAVLMEQPGTEADPLPDPQVAVAVR